MYLATTVKEHDELLAEYYDRKQREAEQRQAVSDAKTDSGEVTVIRPDGTTDSLPALTRGKLRTIEKQPDLQLHNSGSVRDVALVIGAHSCCLDCTDSEHSEEWSEISATRVSAGVADTGTVSSVSDLFSP